MYYKLKRLQKGNGRKPSFFCTLDNGFYSTFAGTGKMLDDFIETGQLINYTGHNIVPKFPGDPNYRKSLLQCATFDQSFNFVNTDVDKREFQIMYLTTYVIKCSLNIIASIFQLFISDEMFDPKIDTKRKESGVIPAHGRFRTYPNVDTLRIRTNDQGTQTGTFVEDDNSDDSTLGNRLPNLC